MISSSTSPTPLALGARHATPPHHPAEPFVEKAMAAGFMHEPSSADRTWAGISRLFCCCPDDSLIDPESMPNWFEIGIENQLTMTRGVAGRLLFSGDELCALNAGLQHLPQFSPPSDQIKQQVNDAVQELTQAKHQMSTDAAGVSRQSIQCLLRAAAHLSSALQQLDQLAKTPARNGQPSSVLGSVLWQPISASPRRSEGAGPVIETGLDRMRAHLSLDIEGLKQLHRRIPA